MPNCIVLGCPHRCGNKNQSRDVILHCFPQSLDRIKDWLLRTGQIYEDLDGLVQRIYESKKTNPYRLCSAHFTIDSYIINATKRILRPTALPSIFPPAGSYYGRKRPGRRKKTKDSSQRPSSPPLLIWQDSWTSEDYLIESNETKPHVSSLDIGNSQWYDKSVSDTAFRDHLQVHQRHRSDPPQSLLAGLKEEQLEVQCARYENGVMSPPSLLESIKSENTDEDEPPEDQKEEDILRIVIDLPTKQDNHLKCPDLEEKTNSRGSDPSLCEAEEMPKCIVKGCPHCAGRKNSTPGVTLHMFPKDLAMIKKWLQQTNQDFGDLDLFAQGILQGKMGVSRICSAHFAPECYSSDGSQKVLMEGSIPTIFPERDKSSKQKATTATPVFQNMYLPLNLWTNNMSVVSNVAPWGLNQVIGPDVTINQDNEMVFNGLGINVSNITQHNTGEYGNVIYENINADLPDATLHEWQNAETDPMFTDFSSKKVDKMIQWPDHEYNVRGELWKVMHDHFYKVPHGSKSLTKGLNHSSLMTEYMSKNGIENYFEATHTESEVFSMLEDMANIFAMVQNEKIKSTRMLNKALEIVSLIAGEEWVILNKNSIHAGVHQLTGEFPVKSGDVAVFFTTDEWTYIEQHKEDYQGLLTEHKPVDGTWEVPEDWDSDAMNDYSDEEVEPEKEPEQEEEYIKEEYLEEEDIEEEDIEEPPRTPLSSDWEPNSEEPDSEEPDSEESEEEVGENPESLVPEEPPEPPKPHKCDQCEEAFADEEALEAHKLTHIVKCEDCEELFSTKAELIKHWAENHATKRYPCTLCGIEYEYKSQFIIHQRAHTGEKPFACEVCGRKFGHRSSLLVHQRRHTEGKTFECTKCDRRFDKKSEMLRHQTKVHDRKKPQCPNCQKTFQYKRTLVKHMRDHCDKIEGKPRKKPYKCKKCGKKFSYKRNYEEHKWEHD